MFNFSLINVYYTQENQSTEIPTRDAIDEKYKWNLKDIFTSDEEWEKDFKWIENNIRNYSQFEGTLSSSAEHLLACLKFDDEVGIKLERLYLYSMLAKDSDMKVAKYQGMDDRIKTIYSKVLAASSYIKPELLTIDEKKISEMLSSNPELEIYRHSFDDLFRFRKHMLDKEKEELLAMAGDVTQVSYNAYSLLTNADLKFPVIEDEENNKIEMSHSRFYAALYSKNRAYRERAFKAYLNPYIENINSLGALFNGNIKSNIFIKRN